VVCGCAAVADCVQLLHMWCPRHAGLSSSAMRWAHTPHSSRWLSQSKRLRAGSGYIHTFLSSGSRLLICSCPTWRRQTWRCVCLHTHNCYRHLITPVRVTPQGCPMYTADYSNFSECCAALTTACCCYSQALVTACCRWVFRDQRLGWQAVDPPDTAWAVLHGAAHGTGICASSAHADRPELFGLTCSAGICHSGRPQPLPKCQ
jgi:hypothetical protein